MPNETVIDQKQLWLSKSVICSFQQDE